MTLYGAIGAFSSNLKRVILYPYLAIWAISCHAVLLAVAIAPLGVPISALLYLKKYWSYIEFAVQCIEDKFGLAELMSLLVGAGVLTWIITTLGKYARDQLAGTFVGIREVWSAWSDLKWSSLDQLETSWRGYIEEAPCHAWKAFKRAKLLTVSLMLCVSLVLLYPMFDPKQTSDSATRDTTQTVQMAYRYVAMFGAREPGAEASDVIKRYMTPGTVFSLVHRANAQPSDGQGICLDEDQQDWLHDFRKAITACAKYNRSADPAVVPTFNVTGYASIAPMHIDGNISESARLNCKVANWRAMAVGAFLADPDNNERRKWWYCKDVAANFNKHPNQCRNSTDGSNCMTFDGPVGDGGKPLFQVKVCQWATPSEMVENKPANDGAMPNPRRFDVEMLNRAVHITVPKDFCRAKKAEAAVS